MGVQVKVELGQIASRLPRTLAAAIALLLPACATSLPASFELVGCLHARVAPAARCEYQVISPDY